MGKLVLLGIGSREFQDYDYGESIVNEILKDYEKENVTIVSGGARGADTFFEKYANNNNYEFRLFKAKWMVNNQFDKLAGIKRNIEMIEHIKSEEFNDHKRIIVAFWNGTSRGTAHCLKEAEERLKNIEHKVSIIQIPK